MKRGRLTLWRNMQVAHYFYAGWRGGELGRGVAGGATLPRIQKLITWPRAPMALKTWSQAAYCYRQTRILGRCIVRKRVGVGASRLILQSVILSSGAVRCGGTGGVQRYWWRRSEL